MCNTSPSCRRLCRQLNQSVQNMFMSRLETIRCSLLRLPAHPACVPPPAFSPRWTPITKCYNTCRCGWNARCCVHDQGRIIGFLAAALALLQHGIQKPWVQCRRYVTRVGLYLSKNVFHKVKNYFLRLKKESVEAAHTCNVSAPYNAYCAITCKVAASIANAGL